MFRLVLSIIFLEICLISPKLGQTLGDGEGQGGLAWCNPWGCKESDTSG